MQKSQPPGVLLYGKGDGETLAKIKKLVSDKTRGSVELKGYVNRDVLIGIYRTASCTIFPSYAESFGMAPLESMLAGCPTIFTERATGEEIITNGVTGLLIDPDNIQEIATAIIKMLSDRKSAIEMGRKGAELVKSKFNISIIADQHIALYESLIQLTNH